MVDVGRNDHAVSQLKQQNDVKAKDKLNVFHFHLTENVAWRLQVKKYPELTSAASMTRNKGKFYTIEEVKELIRYCRDWHIMLVHEIDMPGHLAAFARAMGSDMPIQDGLGTLKEILVEV